MEINEIIEELKRNNYSHFDDFYNLTKKQVYFTAINILKDHHLAEDIMQDTYVSFLNSIQDFKKGSNVNVYLSTIARNLSINMYNKRKRTVLNNEIIDFQSVEIDPFVESNIKRILDLLEDDEEKEIVTFHAILDYKFKDIAQIMNKPLGTVLWIYNKAIKKLKEKVVKENEK